MKTTHPLLAPRHAVAAAALLALFGPAQSADWEFSGLVRQELAYKTTNDTNLANQGAAFNNGGKAITFNGLDLGPGVSDYIDRTAAGGGGCGTLTGGSAGCSLTHPRSTERDIDWNWIATRAELNIDGKLSDKLKATVKVRAIYDATPLVESSANGYNSQTNAAFNPRFSSLAGQIDSGKSFRQKFGGTSGGPLAYANDTTLIDLPAAYVDYNDGPLWIRAGNQQIAWGEALFFRVADQVNGLDLRGQVFGPAAEEYSDKRRSSLGVRLNYRVNEKTDVDTFVQQWAATLLPQGGTSYNFIPDAFTINEKPGYDDAKKKWNVGFRLKGEAGGFGYQGFVINRTDPNGVYKWDEANPAQGAPQDNTALSPAAGAYTGTAATNTNTGVWSFNDWSRGAVYSRLNPIQGVGTFASFGGNTNGAVEGCGALTGANVGTAGNYSINQNSTARCVVDTFAGLGPVRGWLQREYYRETIIGGGINHVFEGEPDSFTDQLISRFEFSWTPDKKFTNPTLGDYIEANEYQYAFIFEKYHKFTSAFPATYFVAQWLHKQRSDIFGRYLDGYDQRDMKRYLDGNGDANSNINGNLQPRGKSGGFNAYALALQQPSPTLEYRFDLAILTDFEGGWYAQPGVKWKPNKNVQADLYLNWFYSQHKGEARDWADGLQNSNEILARVAWLF